ncbi:MAG TPA: hypothetical protein DC049_12925, partial [Spirochaetia bacterium]|nr:hypothetical protein [Spirochaetia bacterium]
MLYTDGNSFCRINGSKIPIKRGLLLITSPGDEHNFSPVYPGYAVYSEITFSFFSGQKTIELPFFEILNVLSGVKITDTASCVCFNEEKISRLLDLIRVLIHALNTHSETAQFQSDIILGNILSFLFTELAGKSSVMSNGESDITMNKIRELIDNNYSQKFYVRVLAEQAGLSPSHFMRKFKALYGYSLITYLHRKRIEAAENLLLSTN